MLRTSGTVEACASVSRNKGPQYTTNPFDTLLTPRLAGEDVFEQERADLLLREIDGTKNYARIGGNRAMVVSLAVAKAAAQRLGIPLCGYLGTPFNNELSYPIANIMGGSPHARVGIDPDLQEHQMIPVNAEIRSEAATMVPFFSTGSIGSPPYTCRSVIEETPGAVAG